MRRAALAAVALTALVAACGGKTKPQSIQPPIRTAPASEDRGKAVIDAFVRAAAARNAEALWELLSAPTRQRLGPLERFRRMTASKLSVDLASFSTGPYREVVSQRITDGFGVVSIVNASRIYALALRLE